MADNVLQENGKIMCDTIIPQLSVNSGKSLQSGLFQMSDCKYDLGFIYLLLNLKFLKMHVIHWIS